MSIEKLLEAATLATEKNTAVLTEVLNALQGNTKAMETLNEGRDQALEALTSKDAEPKKPAPKKTKAAAKKEEAEPEKKADPEPEAEAWNPDISPEGIRSHFVPYLSGAVDEEKAKRVEQLSAILSELGADSINAAEGKKHIESDEDRRRAVFYITRFANGLPVDFKADYDFNSDPLTQATEAAASDDDLVG